MVALATHRSTQTDFSVTILCCFRVADKPPSTASAITMSSSARSSSQSLRHARASKSESPCLNVKTGASHHRRPLPTQRHRCLSSARLQPTMQTLRKFIQFLSHQPLLASQPSIVTAIHNEVAIIQTESRAACGTVPRKWRGIVIILSI